MKIYTRKEAADFLNMHPKVLSEKYLKPGKIKASKFGNKWRIREEEIEKFLKKEEEARENQ